MEADFNPYHLSIRNLRRRMDVRGLIFTYGTPPLDISRGRIYNLWKDNEYITIHAEPYVIPGLNTDDVQALLAAADKITRAYTEGLEVIQTILDDIQFHRSNYAYLVRQKDGTHRLVYKPKRILLDCPKWTRTVELRDIDITRLISPNNFEGVWQDQDVDITIDGDETDGGSLSLESRGYQLMHSLGLNKYVFEMLAHVTRNGTMIGIMTVPPIGRLAEPSDRFAVYQALADLQSHGLLYYAVNIQSIFITDDGIKFVNLRTLHYYEDRDALAKKAEEVHWEALATMFGESSWPEWRRFGGPYDRLLLETRTHNSHTYIIPPNAKPCYSLSTPAQVLVSWLWSQYGTRFGDFTYFDLSRVKLKYSPSSGYTVSIAPPALRKKARKAVLAPSDDDDKELTSFKQGDPLMIDKPLALPVASRRSRVQRSPYDRPPRMQKLILYRGDN